MELETKFYNKDVSEKSIAKHEISAVRLLFLGNNPIIQYSHNQALRPFERFYNLRTWLSQQLIRTPDYDLMKLRFG